MKTAVVVLSDPRNGDEALGRVFNALAVAYDLKQRKQHVEVLFQGAGTRWAAQLTSADHPVHGLYQAVALASGSAMPSADGNDPRHRGRRVYLSRDQPHDSARPRGFLH